MLVSSSTPPLFHAALGIRLGDGIVSQLARIHPDARLRQSAVLLLF
ncbi:MAG: hypothetical protein J7641_20145 [Cyanobacteria bacterium SID2]|nr:hypothetical protein [Cyanobacteria bacterium SID2]MBP0005353.1 hypothetical protein [Cyanobacteria bacterium SBC]